MQTNIEKALCDAKHIIIKIGTNILKKGSENNYFTELAKEVAKIHSMGKKVLLVSSGAVGFGLKQIAPPQKQNFSIPEKQAFASIGQSILINTYRSAFQKVGFEVAQILVSQSDFSNVNHYRNLLNTLNTLLNWNTIPIVNENDAVAVQELKLGDNDTLSASIALLYPTSVLFIMTSTDGFKMNGNLIPLINKITPEITSHAGKPTQGGTGGMITKLIAARTILRAGQIANISNGKTPKILSSLIQGKPIGTWFINLEKFSHRQKQRWLIQTWAKGKITIDQGAIEAIQANASLLAVGITEISTCFQSGETIDVYCQKKCVARGIASISSEELQSLKNKKGVEVIQKENLVLL